MKRIMMLCALAGAGSAAYGQNIAPHEDGEFGVPIDIYYDYSTQAFVISSDGDTIVYEKNEPPFEQVRHVAPPVPDPPPPPPPPPDKGGIAVADDFHVDIGEGRVVEVSQVSFVFKTDGAPTSGWVMLYANNSDNTLLPEFAGGTQSPLAQLQIPDIPYGPGLYNLHIVNIPSVRIPSGDAWFAVQMYCEAEQPVLGVGDEIAVQTGTSADLFAWQGDSTHDPGLYYFGPEGPKADMLLSVSGTTHCGSDFDGSGFTDLEDFLLFLTTFVDGDAYADFDGSGFVDFEDFGAFVAAFESGC